MRPACCNQSGLIEWRDESALYGPEYTGWAIVNGEDYGANLWINVNYCPFCGEAVPEPFRFDPVRFHAKDIVNY